MLHLRVLLCKIRFLLFFKAIFGGWIDPDTPKDAYKIEQLLIIHPKNKSKFSYTSSKRGRVFDLVMSDEFNLPNRTFDDGHDPKWTALDKNDYTNDAMHYYSKNQVRTNQEGELEIETIADITDIVGFDDIVNKRKKVKKYFKSGFLQSWNKFCFTGGIIEAEITLPGLADVAGLWPAFWILGNLARHTYVGSSRHIWPWSTSVCSKSTNNAQLINGCREVDHYDLKSRQGRGAPEIDIFEMQPGPYGSNQGDFWQMPVGQPFMSASYQVAPGKSGSRPGDNWWPSPGMWYDDLKSGNNTCLNILFYGSYNHFRGDTNPDKDYWSDAISFNRQLTSEHFEKSHRYRLEWDLPDKDSSHNKTASKGYLHWFLDDELIFALNGSSLEAVGYGAEISSEPSSILMNTAVSYQWGFPKCPEMCDCKVMNCLSPKWEEKCGLPPGFCSMIQSKPKYKVNWIRVYQDKTNSQHKVGCSTPERPTKRYIKANEESYKNPEDEHP